MLDTVLWHRSNTIIQSEKYGFQSLLCWILYYDLIIYIMLELFLRSFNPYYVGYCTMTWSGKRILEGCRNMFQSLLCWILYYDPILSHLTLSNVFVSILIMLDTVLWLAVTLENPDDPDAFQSLLCWILYYDLIFNNWEVKDISEFQSLLCWILYYDELETCVILYLVICFNPYYVGYCTMTRWNFLKSWYR